MVKSSERVAKNQAFYSTFAAWCSNETANLIVSIFIVFCPYFFVFLLIFSPENSMKQIVGRKTLFGEPKETSAVFCIDRSGSIYKLWDTICTHLVEHLCKMAIRDKNAKFNIVLFDDQVELFRVKMTRVSAQSIMAFRKWFQPMCHGSTSYILPALMASFGFASNKCVYLVTDGLTSNESPQLSLHLPRISSGRPLHCILLSEGTNINPCAIQLASKLISLTCCSNSSLRIICVSYNGVLIHISPEFWCPKIPAHLYGNPEVCFSYIMNTWLEQTRESPAVSTCDAGVETNVEDAKNNAILGSSKTVNNRDGSCIQQEGLRELSHSASVRKTDDGRARPHKPSTYETDEQPSLTTTSGIASESYPADGAFKGGLRETQRDRQQGTTHSVDPECCVCNRAACSPGQCATHPCSRCEQIPLSRYQVSRALADNHSKLDWWRDDMRYAPSAGTLLLGRRVLAPNRTKGGSLYLATVLSQLTTTQFLVSFESPEVKVIRQENIQEQHAADMISFLDYHRHPIRTGDFILLPKCALHSAQSPMNDQPRTDSLGYFLEPYILARVVHGFKTREKVRGTMGPDATIRIQLVPGVDQEPPDQTIVNYDINPNIAIWAPPNIADRVQAGFVAIPKPETNGCECPKHNCSRPADMLVLNPSSRVTPFVSAGLTKRNIPAAYSLTELNLLTGSSQPELLGMHTNRTTKDDSESGDSLFGNPGATCKKPDKYAGDSPVAALTTGPVLIEEAMEANRLCREFCDASTSAENDLKFGRMWMRWNYRKPEHRPKEKKPEWRYWGAKSIPSLLDPPIFEPYRDGLVWGKSDRSTDQGDVVRPEIHFTKVTQKPTHAVNFRDSAQVYMALRDPKVTRGSQKADLSQVCQSDPKQTQWSAIGRQKSSTLCDSDAQTDWICTDSVHPALQDNHRERALIKIEQMAIRQGLGGQTEETCRMQSEWRAN